MTKDKSVHIFVLLTNIYLILLFSVFLLWTGSEGYSGIQQAKTAAYYWLTGGYAGALLLLLAEYILIGKIKVKDFLACVKQSSLTQKMIGLYWLATVLSTLLSDYRKEALWGMSRDEGLITISLYCLVFLLVSVFAKPEKWFLWIFAGSMTVFGGVCLVQLEGYNIFGLFPEGLDYYDANLQFAGVYLGTAGNAGLTAAILTMAIPVLLGAGLKGKNKMRWLYLIPALLNLAVLIRADIQAGLLGFFVGIAVGWPLFFEKSSKGRKIGFCIVALMMIIGLTVVFFGPPASGTLYELGQILHGNWDPNFGNGRIHIWREVLKLVPENLWFGTGPDTMQAYRVKGLSWHHPDSGTDVALMIDVAHNEYLNILFHQGVFALVFYLAALLHTGKRILQSGKTPCAVLGVALLCYCLQAFFSFSMNISAGLFWSLWAILENQLSEREA